MPELHYNVRGLVEAEKFLDELARGAASFAGSSVQVGTRLPRGIFVDVGTRRGVRATHWLSGLVGQARNLARGVLVQKLLTPLQLATALVEVGNKLAGMARGRAPRRSGKLAGSVDVMVSRGIAPGLSRLGRR